MTELRINPGQGVTFSLSIPHTKEDLEELSAIEDLLRPLWLNVGSALTCGFGGPGKRRDLTCEFWQADNFEQTFKSFEGDSIKSALAHARKWAEWFVGTIEPRGRTDQTPQSSLAEWERRLPHYVQILIGSARKIPEHRRRVQEAVLLYLAARAAKAEAGFAQMTRERDAAVAEVARLLEALPKGCDGKEQPAFETWARDQRYDMTEHPLHYLFLDQRTYDARQGWKAAIDYCRAALASASETKGRA